MTREMSKFEKARRAAGISQQQASEIIGTSLPTYIKKEREPDGFTLDEFRRLYSVYGEDEKSILDSYLDDLRSIA